MLEVPWKYQPHLLTFMCLPVSTRLLTYDFYYTDSYNYKDDSQVAFVGIFDSTIKCFWKPQQCYIFANFSWVQVCCPFLHPCLTMFVLSCHICLPRHIIFGLPWSSSAPFLSFTLSAFFSCLHLCLVCLVFLVFVLLFACYLIAADEGAVAVSSSLGFLSYAATLSSCSACVSRLL